MPPKKVNKTVKKAQTQIRKKNQKPILKTPTVLKLQIKQHSSQCVPTKDDKNDDHVMANEEISQNMSPQCSTIQKQPPAVKKNVRKRRILNPKTKKNVQNGDPEDDVLKIKMGKKTGKVPELNKNDLKIMFANEVINLQLQKIEKKKEELSIEKKIHVEKKPILNTKESLKKNVPKDELKKKTVSRTRRPRKASCRYVNSGGETEVKQADVTIEDSKDKDDNDTIFAELPTKRKRKLSINRKIVKAGPKSRNYSKRILNRMPFNNITQLNKVSEATETNKRVEDITINNKWYNRRKSDASSESSWSKDVSSSNASLITVTSKDFILIDNKIPILQLDNIHIDLKENKKYYSSSDNCTNMEINLEDIVENSVNNDDSKINITETPYGQSHFKSTLSCSSSSCSDIMNPVSTFYKSKSTSSQNGRLDPAMLVGNCAPSREHVVNGNDILCTSLNLSDSSSSSFTSTSSSSSDESTCTSLSHSLPDHVLQNSPNKQSNSEEIVKSDCINNELIGNLNTSSPSNVCDNMIINKNMCLQRIALKLKTGKLNEIKLSHKANYDLNNNTKMAIAVKKVQDKLFTDYFLKEESILNRICMKILQLGSRNFINSCNHNEFKANISNSASKLHNPYTQNSHIFNIQKNNNIQKLYPHKEVIVTTNKENMTNSYSFQGDSLPSNQINHSLEDNDDDDALSLFAESITGIETSRRNSSFNTESEFAESEEYIPQPLFKHTIQPPAIINYKPTKIIQKPIPSVILPMETTTQNCISSCEEQIPDSTSIFSESGNDRALQENALAYKDRVGSVPKNSFKIYNTVIKNTVPNAPRLMASVHKPLQGIKSFVFSGICFFYLVSTCKKRICNYPHIYLTKDDLKAKLSMLSEELFIQEYMRIRTWPKLRRRYGLCYVEECIRRELTRILVEMAIDFIVKASVTSPEDRILKSEAVDNILMHLNGVDLSTCDDLLKYNIKSVEGELLCDFFMSVIATSQNFSRFKPVFINLTDFIYLNNRTFSIDVADAILERVCILPYDQSLTRALLVIMKNTEVTIFSNSNIGDFERRLRALNENLHDDFKRYAMQALMNQPALTRCNAQSPILIQNNERINTELGYAGNNIRYSPDTTDLGNMNKTPVVTFKRTIDFNKLKNLKTTESAKPNSEENKYSLNDQFKKWRNRSIFDYLRGQSDVHHTTRQFKSPLKRRSVHPFGASQAKFNRKNGPM